MLLEQQPEHAPACNNLGNLLQAQGRLEDAQVLYERALGIRPGLLEAHLNLANNFSLRGDASKSETGYRYILSCRPDHEGAHLALARLLERQSRLTEALSHFGQAVRSNPNDIGARLALGTLLLRLGRPREAVEHLRAVTRNAPGLSAGHNNLGSALSSLGQNDDAEACFRKAVEVGPEDAGARLNLGSLLLERGRDDEARTHIDAALASRPDAADAVCAQVQVRQKLCDWVDYEPRLARLTTAIERHLAQPDSGPLPQLLLCALPLPPELHLAVAEHHVQGLTRRMPPARHSPPTTARGRLRIGYLSPDLREHPVGILVQDLFAQHDRQRYEVFAYSLAPNDDAVTRRCREGSDSFRNCAGEAAPVIAERIRSDGIDVLVDLAGFTAHARPEVLALRPAPVQAQYLGFPGTMGSGLADYLIADDWLIPPESSRHYAEAIVRLDCGFVASHFDDAGRVALRSETELPPQGFVFCCFNAHHKLDPVAFGAWMRILDRVDGSVLWLRGGREAVESNLRRQAERCGIDPARLVFAPKRSWPEYLACCRIADLFLDSFHYAAGSTGVAVLSVGLPLLTMPGQTYASRMGASLCAATGLDSLICADIDAFVERAVTLATDEEQLAVIRGRLMSEVHPLFDTATSARGLEQAYTRMWERYRTGGGPAAFRVEAIGG